MENKRIDWEERHFQIVLALLNRTDLYNGHSQTPSLSNIINGADRMIGLLKERETVLDNLPNEQNKEIGQK